MRKDKTNVVLIGMMGCGKTTIAKLLKDKLHKQWIDMDQYIENQYQMSISQMFDISEDYFRERETACCLEIAKQKHCIISTGGGVIQRYENIEALKQSGYIIYIDRPIPLILEDVDTSSRPLLKEGAQKLYDLYQVRHPLYLQACDYHVDNDGTLEDVCHKIIDLLKKL
ncbi:shikimate kinase [Massilimicrobiota timonensis]|uniref:shikimate kinase n=1 Tax=Massilimicrobiota timonensis TaxID=1776392 RepID=UPI0036F237EB